MAKITLPDIAAQFASAAALNSRFQEIEDHLNDLVLYRVNPEGEPNAMGQILDMNGYQIANLPFPVAPTDAVRLQDMEAFDVTLAVVPQSTARYEFSDFTVGSGSTTFTKDADQAVGLLYLNGVFQEAGIDYSYTSTVITFLAELLPADVIHIISGNDTGLNVDAGSVAYTPPVSGSVTTDVESKLAERVSVKDFGAVGDGLADDTGAIAAALVVLKPLGGELYFPSGTYNFTSIDLEDTTNNNPIRMVGSSRVGARLQHTATTGTAIRVRPDSCWIEHLTVIGAGSGTADGIYLKDTSGSGPKNMSLNDVQVFDFTGGRGVINDGFANAFHGLIITTCDIGYEDAGSGGHTLMSHSFISNCTTYGVEITGSLRHMHLDSVNIESSPTGFFSGSASSGVGNLVLTSCHFEGNTVQDIRLGNGTHDCIINGGRYSGTNSTSNTGIQHVGASGGPYRIYLNGPEFVDNAQGVNTDVISAGTEVHIVINSIEGILEGFDPTANLTLGTDARLVLPLPQDSNGTDLADSGSYINTVGKHAGKQVWDTTTQRPVFALSDGSGAAWDYSDGTTAYNP